MNRRILFFILNFFCLTLTAQNLPEWGQDSVVSKKTGKYEWKHVTIDKITHRPRPYVENIEGRYVAGYCEVLDKAGKRISMHYIDTAGNPTPDNEGIAAFAWKYDKQHEWTEIHYYGLDGKEVKEGDYSLRDKKGRELESGRIRLNDTARINFWKTTYDPQGNLLSEVYYRLRDSIGKLENEYSVNRYYYDKAGRFIGYSYYDSEGKLIEDVAHGYEFASVKYLYDESGQLKEIAWLDKDSMPVDMKDYNGYYSKLKFTYSENKLSEIAFYDKENDPSSGTINNQVAYAYPAGRYARDTYRRFSRKKYGYSRSGRIISETYYDTYGEQLWQVSYRYFLGFLRSVAISGEGVRY